MFDDDHAGIRGLVTDLTYYVVVPVLSLCTRIRWGEPPAVLTPPGAVP
jgi:hypothetical protein